MDETPRTSMAGYEAAPPQRSPLPKENAPGATAAMVCGIVGVFVVGLVLGIIAIALAAKAKRLIAAEPLRYGGRGMATTGLVLGIIDVCVWGLIIVPWIVIAIVGMAASGAH